MTSTDRIERVLRTGAHPGWRVVKRGWAALVSALGLAPVVLAGLAAGLLEARVSAVAAGAVTAALVFWPLLLVAVGALPLVFDPGSPRGRRLRRPGVVTLLLLVQLGWLPLTQNPLPEAARSQAYYATARSDLVSLASQQEIHFEYEGSYTDDYAALAFMPWDERTVISLDVTPTGWVATATHAMESEVSCAVYGGDVAERPSTNRGHQPDRPQQVICEPILPMGAFGEWLQRYHGLLGDNRLSLS